MKVILVQLADEAGEIAVFEVLGEDGLGKSLVLSEVRTAAFWWDAKANLENDETVSFITPPNHLRIRRVFQHSAELLGATFRGDPWDHTCTTFVPRYCQRKRRNARWWTYEIAGTVCARATDCQIGVHIVVLPQRTWRSD